MGEGDVWGIPPPPEACKLLGLVRNNKKIGTRGLGFPLMAAQSLSAG